jgi:hypothetical protein
MDLSTLNIIQLKASITMEEKKRSNLDLVLAGYRHNVSDFKAALQAIIKLESLLKEKEERINKLEGLIDPCFHAGMITIINKDPNPTEILAWWKKENNI